VHDQEGEDSIGGVFSPKKGRRAGPKENRRPIRKGKKVSISGRGRAQSKKKSVTSEKKRDTGGPSAMRREKNNRGETIIRPEGKMLCVL